MKVGTASFLISNCLNNQIDLNLIKPNTYNVSANFSHKLFYFIFNLRQKKFSATYLKIERFFSSKMH